LSSYDLATLAKDGDSSPSNYSPTTDRLKFLRDRVGDVDQILREILERLEL